MAYSLERVGGKNRDFSNPMYDAVVQSGNGAGIMGKYTYFIFYTIRSYSFYTCLLLMAYAEL